MKKLYVLIASNLVFFSFLIVVYICNVKFFQVNVVFYSAILDVLITVFICGSTLFIIKQYFIFSVLERLQLIIIWFLIGYSLAISVPTVLDRSLSFYILEKVQQRGGGIRLDAFEDVFTTEYVFEHRLVDVRLTEQLESGTIEIKDGCVKLTPKGKRIADFSRYFRRNFLPKQRLLMGQYTDDLTDPFKNSIGSKEYTCK